MVVDVILTLIFGDARVSLTAVDPLNFQTILRNGMFISTASSETIG